MKNDYQEINDALFIENGLVNIPTNELSVGMNVKELDKPWIESSFLFQGIIIESQSDIDALRSECSSVYIESQNVEGMSSIHGDKAVAATVWGTRSGGRN